MDKKNPTINASRLRELITDLLPYWSPKSKEALGGIFDDMMKDPAAGLVYVLQATNEAYGKGSKDEKSGISKGLVLGLALAIGSDTEECGRLIETLRSVIGDPSLEEKAQEAAESAARIKAAFPSIEQAAKLMSEGKFQEAIELLKKSGADTVVMRENSDGTLRESSIQEVMAEMQKGDVKVEVRTTNMDSPEDREAVLEAMRKKREAAGGPTLNNEPAPTGSLLN